MSTPRPPQLNVRIPASLLRALKVHAAKTGRPIGALVVDAIRLLLKRKRG